MNDPAVPPHLREVSDPIAPILAASEDRPFVVAQLGQSLDGRIATISGESRWINNGDALDHLHRLRAAVDAVVVGVGTVMADDPKLSVRRIDLPDGRRQPARVIIDPDGRMPSDRCCLVNDGSRRIIVTGATAVSPSADAEIVRLDRHDRVFRPGEIVAALFALGLRRLLVEGGAMTISSFLDAGVIDRLHLLIGPVIIGSGKPGLQLRPIKHLSSAIRPRVAVHPLASGDVIFDCDLRTRKAV